MHFRYLQLQHAYQAQFPANNTTLANNPLLEAIKCPDPKKLISQFYSMLSLPQAAETAYILKARWEGEIGPLQVEEWSKALDTCKLVSSKLSDHLTQIFILHRLYLTPLKIARYRPNQATSCPMCCQATGSFYLWQCSKMQTYWTQVVQFLHDTMGSPITVQPKPCLLGIF